MEQDIIIIFKKYDCGYVKIECEESTKKIHKLFCENIIFDPVTTDEMRYVGMYHYKVTKNYEEMEKHFCNAIDKGNVMAIYNLGHYHHHITKNYQKMEKFYKLAIDKGNEEAMFSLAYYHDKITHNYEEMEKYYLMAINLGDSDAMNNLGTYYEEIIKDYIEMEKYYLMAITNGNNMAFHNLTIYYEEMSLHMDLLKLCVQFDKMVNRDKIIEAFNIVSCRGLTKEEEGTFLNLVNEFEFLEMDKLCVSLKLLVRSVKENIHIMDLHFTYSVNGLGFEDAKKDFFNRCLS